MSFQTIDGSMTIVLDLVATTVLSGLLLMLGYFIKKKVPVLAKFCIPAPVIGGLIFAIIAWIFFGTGVMRFKLDTTLQTPFMIAFFACVGFGGSFALLKAGGKSLLIFLVLCWTLAVVQNAIGVGLASAMGVHPVLGVMAGAVSLVGGHGNAAAFGPEAEAMGVVGATTVAFAAATYGLISGALLGGPMGNYLITKFKVPIKTSGMAEAAGAQINKKDELPISGESFMRHMTIIGVFMALGGLITVGVKAFNIPNLALPGYVGAMFIAILFRNVNDKVKAIQIDERLIDLVKEISLGFFLTMAIMTLKIWELTSLAIPLIVILLVQTIIVLLYVRFLAWPALGKNYDTAVMLSGYVGASLGVTATAVANMSAVCEKYDTYSAKAFLIVPLSCAVFVDVIAIPAILFFMSYFA